VGKTAGPELNELALANQVDVILTADQPASTLFMKSNDWVAISRLMYNRTSTYVPLKSKISTLEDLKGKQVGVPFGTAAQRVITEALTQAKVEGVKFVNLGMLEHAPLITKYKDDEKWGEYDALSGFDPIPAILEVNKNVKVVHKGKVCSMVLVNKGLIEKNEKLAKNLIKSIQQAYEYYIKNEKQANEWFVAEALMKNASDEVFAIAAEYEPNLKKGEKIRTTFNDDDFKMIQNAADFVSKSTNKTIKITDFVTNKYQ
ncbi:MAG: ABC transporter substrate-binding protein, partial [Pseudobdellovibrio sp.]